MILYPKKSFLKIYSQSAEQGSSLSALTNLGVNTNKFSKEFNEFTKGIENYILLYVIVSIDNNRNYSFIIQKPTTGTLLNLFKFDKVIKVWVNDRFNDITIQCINLEDVLYIALFKFPFLDIKKSFFIVFGTLKSLKLRIIN